MNFLQVYFEDISNNVYSVGKGGFVLTFGSRLKQARNDKKLTQAEAAKLVGIDDTTLSKYENDKSEPDNETLRKLIELYGVSYDWLYGDKNKLYRNNLKEKEMEILELLRKYPEAKQDAFLEFLKSMGD